MPRALDRAATALITAKSLSLRGGNWSPASQRTIVSGLTATARARARPDGSPPIGPARNACSAPARPKNPAPSSVPPWLIPCPPLSSRPGRTPLSLKPLPAHLQPPVSDLGGRLPDTTPGQPPSARQPAALPAPDHLQPDGTDHHMHALQILALLLAASAALNIAFTTGIIARHAGASTAQAILTAAGATGTVMAIFFTAVSAYR